ncbi:hypothetical protein [Agromyces neolithicus]|uniref:hypothetical protein n=1 Tax=Agromyces neolithicus TaxID=269420 RepID=UPI0031CEDDBC
MWRYRLAWVTLLAWAIASPEGRAQLRWTQPGGRPESISPKTFLAAAKEASSYADYDTGRNVTVGRARLGRAVARSERTMTRFWRAVNALGFARTREDGRYLRASERAAAYRRHGNRQLRMASLRDLISPRNLRFVHLPSEGGLKAPEAFSKEFKHQRASAQERASAPRPHSPDSGLQNSRGTSRRGRVIWGRQMFEFARAVRDRLPWLHQVHPSSVARVLEQADVDPARWEAGDLTRRLEQELRFRANAAKFGQRPEAAPRAYRFMNPAEVGDPLGYTRWLLAEYIDPNEPTLTEDRALYRAEQAERAAAQLALVDDRTAVEAAVPRRPRALKLEAERAERDAERAAAARAAALSPEEFSRLRAESDREIAEAARRKRRGEG